MLESLLLSWIVLSLIIAITAAVIPGVNVRGFWGVVLVAALFGVLNVVIGWSLFVLIGIGTLGLGFLLAFVTRIVVNAILLKLVDALTTQLTITDFRYALLAAVVMSGLGTLMEWMVGVRFVA
ncbi:phage holin family protein [Paraliomyxa miuraensis]|uniref:phage holin family protein n=1 Tax=Paraliomyxa miuraensis TaxID=376150 RepID=UPI00224CF7E1|nr:phage holin family protein [Paraliomyxa miuraensis]MCX4243328.1 phage holin family protein [Paraliomyxa miuraensis]